MTVDWQKAQQPFDKQVTLDSQKHSESVYPQESVGIVVNGKYIPLDNVHPDPENHFKIDNQIAIEYANEIQAVIHSHPLETHPAHPSQADQLTQISWDIPFGIQLINKEGAGNIIWWGDGIDTAHYIGRPYIFGVYDCYSIWRDYYKNELGIELRNIRRSEDFWNTGDDIYGDNAKSLGFYEVDVADIQPNDIILTKIRSKIVNHGILYLGGDTGLHHMPYRLSTKESISRYMNPQKEIFDSVWRYAQ